MPATLPPLLKPLAQPKWNLDQAQHLLRRMAFGGTESQAHALRIMGREAAVERLLSGRLPDMPTSAPLPKRLVASTLAPASSSTTSSPETPELRAENKRLRLFSLQEAWLRAMHSGAAPLEKRTLFWHGMLTSAFNKVDNRPLMLAQNARLRQLGGGDYRVLVSELCVDPAMVRYLDIDRNSRRQPNENFARELLELFTLGEGNYSDSDIKELAKVFVNLQVETPPDRPASDSDEIPSLRRSAGFRDRMRLIQSAIGRIFRKPVCGELLCRRLLRFYLTDTPEEALIKALATVLRQQQWQITPTLRILFNSERFYANRDRGLQIKPPVQFFLQALTDLGIKEIPSHYARFAMDDLGQSLFNPPTVAGWPGGRSWINSSTLPKRYQLMQGLIQLALNDADSPLHKELMLLPHLPEITLENLITTWFPHLLPLHKQRLLQSHLPRFKENPERLLLALAHSPEYQLC